MKKDVIHAKIWEGKLLQFGKLSVAPLGMEADGKDYSRGGIQGRKAVEMRKCSSLFQCHFWVNDGLMRMNIGLLSF